MAQTTVGSQLVWLAALVAAASLATSQTAIAKEASVFTSKEIKKFDDCVYNSVFSFLYPENYPPTTTSALKEVCRNQTEAFKCVRESSKGSHPLVRRGLITMIATRQRGHKRVCANPESEHSKQFVAGAKCLLENKIQQLAENDIKLVHTLSEIVRRNYNDSAKELKQFCCAMHNFKRGVLALGHEACPRHKAAVEEILEAIVTEDITMICDDDDKLAKLCPKLEKLVPANTAKPTKRDSGASTALYIVTTLGEPDESKPVLN